MPALYWVVLFLVNAGHVNTFAFSNGMCLVECFFSVLGVYGVIGHIPLDGCSIDYWELWRQQELEDTVCTTANNCV